MKAKKTILEAYSSWDIEVTILLVVLATISPRVAWAQADTATLYGTVTDPTGGVIPGATVTLTEQDTHVTLTRTTGRGGEFAFSFVPPGLYTLKIEIKGFKTYLSTGIALGAGQQVRQTLALEVGAVTETVNVKGTAPLVNTVSSQKLHPYSEREVRQLPLPNRNFTRLVSIEAGVTKSIGNDATGVDINGVGKNGTQYSTDGINASGNVEGNNPSFYQAPNLIDIMSIEGIQEVTTIKGYIPAEYEDAIGGQVNLITKSGTNEWHGSVFENFQDAALNARPQVLSFKAGDVFNQWGGSLGGPIVKNRVFIFGAAEFYREAGNQAVQGDSPTPQFRQQLLAAVPALKPALDQFPEPTESFGPTDLKARFVGAAAAKRSDNHMDVKGDIMLTASSRLSVTYRHGEPFRLIPSFFVDDPRTWENTVNGISTSFVTGGATWTSESRFGFNKPDQIRLDKFFDTLNPSGRKESFPFGERFPRFSLSGVIGGPDAELDDLRGTSWLVSEKYARHIGRHSLRFGGDYHRGTGIRNNPEIPGISFANVDDMLNNRPIQLVATFGSGDFTGRQYEFGSFIQDDWRATPTLTINLGLRYDFYSNVKVTGKGLTPNAGLFNPESLSQDGKFTVGPFRDPRSPFDNDAVNFGPRLGFAWNPDGQGKTAIRGGLGMLFSNLPQGWFWIATSSEKNFPFRDFFTQQDIAANNLQFPEFNDDLAAITKAKVQNNPAALNVFEVINTHLQDPYTIQ